MRLNELIKEIIKDETLTVSLDSKYKDALTQQVIACAVREAKDKDCRLLIHTSGANFTVNDEISSMTLEAEPSIDNIMEYLEINQNSVLDLVLQDTDNSFTKARWKYTSLTEIIVVLDVTNLPDKYIQLIDCISRNKHLNGMHLILIGEYLHNDRCECLYFNTLVGNELVNTNRVPRLGVLEKEVTIPTVNPMAHIRLLISYRDKLIKEIVSSEYDQLIDISTGRLFK